MRTWNLDAEVKSEGEGNLFRPNINKKGTIIDVSFVELGLYFRAERISESLERISAEISVSMDIPSDRGVRRERILWSRASLLDDRSKDAFVQSLEHATEEKSLRRISYDEVTSEAFGCIISAHREGESVEELTNMSTATGRVFHLRPLLLSKVPNLIWAQGGSFKSYFAQLCCVMTDRGYSDFGLTVKSPAKVLYVDYEESLDTFSRRICAIQRGLGFPNPETSGILWKKMYQPFASSIEEISKTIRDRGVEFLVIDSMNPALGGMSISSEAVEKFFEALGSLNITSLILDHANRSAESNATGTSAIYGSAFKYNRSRMVYELKKKQEDLSGSVQVVLYHRKTNDFKIQAPKGFSIKFDMRQVQEEGDSEYQLDLVHSVKFTPLRLGDADAEFLKSQPLSEVARELIEANGPTPIGELAESIAMVKEQELSMNVMTNVVNSSKLLELDDRGLVRVTYGENASSNGSVIKQLEQLGARVVEETN